MKIVVIPDIHLKPWLFDRAEDIITSGRADMAVCLMDMPDDWDSEWNVEEYSATFDRAIKFAKDFPDTLWCLGNHEMSYVWGKLETGYSPYAEQTVMGKLMELEHTLKDRKQLAFVHKVDKVIFSHGGISESFANRSAVDELLTQVSEGQESNASMVDSVIAALNMAPPDVMWTDNSPLWLRPQRKNIPMYKSDEYIQVVGHTPVSKIFKEHNTISTDTFSTYRTGLQIGESAMLVIDSKTGKYKKIPVQGRP